MQNSITRRVSRSGCMLLAGAATLFQPGCGSGGGQEESALLVSAEELADIAGTAAAEYYGGPSAGAAASAGLYALGSVLQGYVGKPVPARVVEGAPGVKGVGSAVEGVVDPYENVTQADVNLVYEAAALEVSVPGDTKAWGAAGHQEK